MKALVCGLAALCLTLPVFAAAPPLPAGISKGASVEGITEYDLPNGLRVLLFPDSSRASTTVNVTYLVGSSNESYGETGMAHLLEHLMFKGSTNHPKLKQELTDHGAQVNGTTSYDRTNYFETFDGTDANLDWAINMEADRMVNSFIAKKDLDPEMTVVRNEFEQGENSPTRVLFERVLSAAYLWHNYGKSTIGARSDIERVPIANLQAFYHTYYQPDNAVVTISGHIDPAKTLALVAKYFEPVPKPTRQLKKLYTEEPVQDGQREVTVRRVGDQKIVMVGMHVPALSNHDGVLGDVIGNILADSPSGRLYKSLVEAKKAGTVFDYEMDTRQPGMLLIGAQSDKSGNIDDIRTTILTALDDIQAHPPTNDEVNRAKSKIGAMYDEAFRNSDRLGILLSEFIAAGDWRLAFLTRDWTAQATPADVAQFARAYLVPSNRTIGEFIPTDKPERAQVPAPPDVEALVKDYKGHQALAQGERFDPTPANVDARSIRATLQPGIKMVMVPKKTRGATVRVSMNLHFGDESSLHGKTAISSLTAGMLLRGTSKHTREQISDELAKLETQLRVDGNNGTVNVFAETTRENLPAVLNLAAEVLEQPTFPDAEFETLKQQEVTALEAERSDPRQFALDAMMRHVFPFPKGDVRYKPTIDEHIQMIKAVTLPEVKSFYQNFYGASHAELAVVGDFDAEQVQKQASSAFQSWSSKPAYARIQGIYKDVPAVNQKFETPDKANAWLIAAQPVKLSDDNPDYPAMELANYMLGGGFLSSRLPKRIRDVEGLSYGVGTQLRTTPVDQNGLFLMYAISAPQNTPKVEASFFDEMKRTLSGGFTDDEVRTAKAGYLQQEMVARAEDSSLAGELASNAFWNRTMKWQAGIDEKVKALTTAQVNEALRKYIDPAKISIFKAGDFAKAGEAKGATKGQ